MPKSSDHYFGRITHEKSYSGTDFYRYDLYERLKDGKAKPIGYIDFVRSLYLYAVVCLLSFLAVLVLAMMQIAGS